MFALDFQILIKFSYFLWSVRYFTPFAENESVPIQLDQLIEITDFEMTKLFDLNDSYCFDTFCVLSPSWLFSDFLIDRIRLGQSERVYFVLIS